MKVWVIARPVEGSWLNGDEYMMDEHENIRYFKTEKEASDCLKNLFTAMEIYRSGVTTIEIEVNENELHDQRDTQ